MNKHIGGVGRAMRAGAREAFGVPAAVLGAGFIGYGSPAACALACGPLPGPFPPSPTPAPCPDKAEP